MVANSQQRSPQEERARDRNKRNGRAQFMKTKTITITVFLAVVSACFGQEKTPPITIDCTFNNIGFGRSRPRGYSTTKVAPEKIVFLRPGVEPGNGTTL